MFLYVFTFLLMAIVGLYTQIFAMQSSQLSANQRAVAEIMSRWHDESYRVAKTNLATLFTVSPCFVLKEGDADSGTCGSAVVPDALSGLTNEMKFNSVAYQVGGGAYLITYAVDDVNGYSKAGFKSAEIFRQMRNADFDGRMFGQVTSATCAGFSPSFMTTTKLNDVTVCYPIGSGASASVPDGAVGFISML